VTCQADLRIPAGVPLSTPYWTPRADAARYDFEPGVPFGVPFRPSPFRVTARWTIAGADVRLERVVQHRYGDLLAGEKRMELTVVPDLAVRVSPDIVVIPAAAADGTDAAARHVDVTVINQGKEGGAATVACRCRPAGRPRRRRRPSASGARTNR
jgi:hypothetical protein